MLRDNDSTNQRISTKLDCIFFATFHSGCQRRVEMPKRTAGCLWKASSNFTIWLLLTIVTRCLCSLAAHSARIVEVAQGNANRTQSSQCSTFVLWCLVGYCCFCLAPVMVLILFWLIGKEMVCLQLGGQINIPRSRHIYQLAEPCKPPVTRERSLDEISCHEGAPVIILWLLCLLADCQIACSLHRRCRIVSEHSRSKIWEKIRRFLVQLHLCKQFHLATVGNLQHPPTNRLANTFLNSH